MKSTLFVVLIALAIAGSFAVKIKGSCPNPEKPKVDYWDFSNFLGGWFVLGRSEDTVPRTVYNTLQINHLYPGKVAVIEDGDTRGVLVEIGDEYIEMTVGDFDGKSYYDVITDVYDPYSFNITTSDGHRGQFWMPYYANPKYAQALLASCVKIDDSTVDIKTWLVSKDKKASVPLKIYDLAKALTGQDIIDICQGDFC
ncbi:uncharacterized protein LOC107359484 [Tetranychus urticae]|uniref:uncharacterized protein LOC107359484 n=1 Tax=Tetranychus urticae TaxID=32264 RepID=UPI000356A57A|nr:uncharacterized protein LOC107359484 [Tetranychus urticae]